MEIHLQPFQSDFLYSKARHPAFVAGWCSGKTLIAILRSRIYSKMIPENLGIIFRKTARSLNDSTLRDFERYTKLKISADRNLVDKNGSITMFRHIDEIDSINQQNINLGWFYIEQGDELDSDREFMMLFGRLRRELKPTEDFIKLGLPLRSGWVIANAGDHWMRPLWKDGKLQEYATQVPGHEGKFAELIETDSFANSKHIPADTISSWKILEKASPLIYRQFVLNDWDITADQFILIPGMMIEALRGVRIGYSDRRRIISCDPSMGGDECVMYMIEDYEIRDQKIMFERDTMKIAGEMKIMAQKWDINEYALDTIGIGQGIGDRLREMGGNVYAINSADSAGDEIQFYNKRIEMWWYVMKMIQDKKIPYPKDELLRKQLSSPRFKVVNSNGRVQLEPKEMTKKRLGSSPDRADAFIYGISHLQYARPYKHKNSWATDPDEDGSIATAVRSAMAA